jgi:hypothetical protein
MKMIYNQDGEFKRCAFIVPGTSWQGTQRSRGSLGVTLAMVTEPLNPFVLVPALVFVEFNHDNDFGQPKSPFSFIFFLVRFHWIRYWFAGEDSSKWIKLET